MNFHLAPFMNCETNNTLNELRMAAFKTNSVEDREKHFMTLNLAFQNGDLVARELVEDNPE